jgi:hypothetical protein
VRAGLRTCSWLCADAQHLQCLLCCTRLAEPAERSCLVFLRCDPSHPTSPCMGLSARVGELATPLSILCMFSRHLIIFDVELALATRVRGDGLVLFAGLRWVQAFSQALSCPVVSRFLRRLGGEVAGHVNHVGRCRWASGRRVTTSFRVSHHVSLLAVSRLLRCVALWRTLGRPEDSLSSNVVFGRERRTPHLARRSRQLKRQCLRSLASPGRLS